MGERLTEEMRAFLLALSAHANPVGPGALSVPAGHTQDMARQKCRRLGLAARLAIPTPAGIRKRWVITEAGRAALAAAPDPHPEPSR